jgi:peptidoglycan hydrolase-like protein with peptidoglycan-binding domain
MGKFSHPVLRRGDHGDDVKNMQSCLQKRGYFLGPQGVDGFFGQHTQDAVKLYQFHRWCNLPIPPFSFQPVPNPPPPFPPVCQPLALIWPLQVDGVVGFNTWSRLDPDEIKKGSKGQVGTLTGSFVRLGQLLLNLGPPPASPPLAIDGDFEDLTRAAVIAFQTAHGLTKDGIIGDDETWPALHS